MQQGRGLKGRRAPQGRLDHREPKERPVLVPRVRLGLRVRRERLALRELKVPKVLREQQEVRARRVVQAHKEAREQSVLLAVREHRGLLEQPDLKA